MPFREPSHGSTVPGMYEAETRALRRAAMLLLTVSVVRWGWPSPPADPSSMEHDALPVLLDSTREAVVDAERRARPLQRGELIDPNRAPPEELDRLPGVGPATAREIVAERDRGGAYREPRDLLRVRGIGDATVAKIEAHLDLTLMPPGLRRGLRPPAPPLVNLNRADEELLETLPGVGPALAQRIIESRREQLFRTVEDLERVRGIGPATVERLRALVTLSTVRR